MPSPYLHASKFDIQEIASGLPEQEVISHLLAADISVLVTDPYRLLEPIKTVIPTIAARGQCAIVVNGQLPPSTTQQDLRSALEAQFQTIAPSTAVPEIAFVSADLALIAQEALWQGLVPLTAPASRAAAVELFQTDFLASNMTALQQSLLSHTATMDRPQSSTAEGVARVAIAHAHSVLTKDRAGMQSAVEVLHRLQRVTSKAASSTKHASVANRGIEGGVVEGGVRASLHATKHGMEKLFISRWSWLSLVGRARADEIGVELTNYLDSRFGRDLERDVSRDQCPQLRITDYSSFSRPVACRNFKKHSQRRLMISCIA